MYRSKWFSCNGGFILSSFHEFISRDSFQGRFNFIPRLAANTSANCSEHRNHGRLIDIQLVTG